MHHSPSAATPRWKTGQCAENRFRPHQANASPATPTSSTPAMIGTSPGLPKSPEPSLRETAAAWVVFADFVTGVSQLDPADGLDSEDGLAEAAEGATLVVASGVGLS